MRPLTIMPVIVMLVFTACRSVEPRPAVSSYGCMRAVRDQTLAGLDPSLEQTRDKHLHCVVSAHIARQCSMSEAYLAGFGKELKDLITPGADAEWADWQADRAGVRCARDDGAAIDDCCAAHGY